jgi:hypothetical protein
MNLIEPGVKYHLCDSLKICHDKKFVIQSWLYNAIGYFLFFCVLALIMYFSRKRKLTPFEFAEKQRKDQDYIMSKIKQYQTAKRPDNTSAITNLPVLKNGERFEI